MKGPQQINLEIEGCGQDSYKNEYTSQNDMWIKEFETNNPKSDTDNTHPIGSVDSWYKNIAAYWEVK